MTFPGFPEKWSKFGVKLYAFASDNKLHVHCDTAT